MIGKRELSLLADGSILINTGRSFTVDGEALLAELKTRRITAALDVFDEEPLPPGFALARMPNVVLTPHVGFVAAPVYAKFAGGMVECLEAWLAGKPLVRLLTPG